MINTFKKLLSLVLCVSIMLIFSATSGMAQTSSGTPVNPRDEALKNGKGIDKTPFQQIFSELDKEVKYSDIYNQTVTPEQPDFEQKFKSFVKRLDDYNKKHGNKNSFDAEKILNGKNIFQDNSIPMGGGNGDGKNSLDPKYIVTGDVVLINNPGVHIQGPIQHAGMMDKRKYSNWDSKCYITAQPNLGVIYETTNQYRNGYDESWICMVDGVTNEQAVSAVDKVTPYLGKPYYWYASKSSTDKWYCSKVAWYGYNYATSVDIDADGGYWCLPVDIYNSDNVIAWLYFE